MPLEPDMFAGCAPGLPPIRIGGKWTVRIAACLRDEPRRFTELQTALGTITPKVLTESLRAMERDGLVLRTDYGENPPRVEYALSELGRTLFGPIEVACAWMRMYAQARAQST
ncbi:transcriptional regulator [Actinomadura logoneensis]|uniref:Transcriptional regulator n=1 Tax=Actinomadura logoneensis TaxID=2293572 RepID=A0A372JBB0_9ACTN|nr:helix-turn-helix domain-containing protein [Actinomadura logoneensis]RFU37260.1 transcriptional regulator [Actinomadura logoneensis]